jgi:hypothetical protein
MNKEELRFEIDQLRKDKIIYGVEATAFNLAMILLIVSVYNTEYQMPVLVISTILGVGYTAYMGLGNLIRLIRIKKLEKS